jgi:putative ABC transport system permease protein
MGQRMGQGKMLLRVIAKALWVRPGKLLLSLTALTIGATLASAFLSLYFDLPQKMSGEFRTLGPNLVAAPRGQNADDAQTFPADAERRIASNDSGAATLPWLYAVGQVSGHDLVLGGTALARLAELHPSWHGLPSFAKVIDGQPSEAFAQEGVIAGETAVGAFGWKIGDTVRIAYGGKELALPLLAIVSTGESEDSRLILPLERLQSLTGEAGRLSLIQIAAPGPANAVDASWRRIAAALADMPGVEIRPLRPVVESEARVVMKVRGLMLGLAGIVLALVVLSVLTTVSGRILDRQKDIGVMKALGGSDAAIARLFLAETSLQALAAAAMGFAAGFALARLAAERIFHSSIALRWDVAAAVGGITLVAALVATVVPARWIRGMDAAVILRGE